MQQLLAPASSAAATGGHITHHLCHHVMKMGTQKERKYLKKEEGKYHPYHPDTSQMLKVVDLQGAELISLSDHISCAQSDIMQFSPM